EYDKPRSFIAMFKKNRQNEFATISSMSEGIYDAITLDGHAFATDTLGIVTSPLMGPAQEWKVLQWEGESTEAPSTDRTSFDVVGVSTTGVETTLASGLGVNQSNYDISFID